MIQERAYAKINLGLEVGPLRQDGYHEMNTIMVPIDLYDELTFDFKEEEGILLIDNTNINSYLIGIAINKIKKYYSLVMRIRDISLFDKIP